MPRPGILQRIQAHPKARVLEISFFTGIGVILAVLGWWILDRWGNLGLALIFWIIGFCTAVFGLLPPRRSKKEEPKLAGKRGEIQEKVKASKAERKKKGPPPPHPPIRRG